MNSRMMKQKKRKPRIRRKLVNGEWYHVYRVTVEQVRHQTVIIEAKSQDEAEQQARDRAEDYPYMWREDEARVGECTSVERTDGAWEPCNAMGYCDAR